MKKRKSGIPIFLIGLILTGVLYGGLLLIERQVLSDYEQKTVVRCTKSCPAGIELTGSIVQEYFELTAIAADFATAQTFETLEEIVGSYPVRPIDAGEILYTPVLAVETADDKLLAPISISVTADAAYAVAGRIRKGDTVNVYVENKDTKEYDLVLNQVVVQNVYDSNAVQIGMSNETALASMFVFYVPASVENSLAQLYGGKVAVLKIR